MLRQYKKQLIFASVLTLLPMALGLFVRDLLPGLMTARWGFDGSVSVLVPMFVMPPVMLALLWGGVLLTLRDPGNRGQNGKVFSVVLWILPVLSNLVFAMVFALSLGVSQALPKVFIILMSLMFSVVGNFMPKTRRNSTIGIRVCWTLASDENWNATHRFTGRLWFTCGILMMFSVCLPTRIGLPLFICLVFGLAFAPMVYSYLYYRRQRRAGTVPEVDASRDVRFGKWSTGFLLVIFLFVGAVMFTGNIRYDLGQDSLTIHASYYSDMTLPYDAIDDVEYRESDTPGYRAFGWGSARLLMGAFENDEFGTYTRYSYTGCDSCVVVRSGGKVLVLSAADEAGTQALYESLAGKAGQP
ncbi:MAG: SdpI family protein [Eubacteriales bacterium]|nr:SdpI family protein [Eubacteriales bacterium]